MKKVLSTLLGLCAAVVAYSQESPRVAATSEIAMQFSRIGHSPAIEAVGGAGITSSSNSAWASYYNPAVVPFSSKKADLAVSYNSWKPSSSSYLNLAGSYNIGDMVGITAGATLGMGKTMTVADEFGTASGYFRPMDYQFNVGVAYRFKDWFSIGVNARYIGQKLYTDFSQGTFATDCYFMAKYGDFKGTVGFDNLGGRVTDMGGNKWNIPSSVTFAGGYEHTFLGVHGLEAEIRGDYYFIEDKAYVRNPWSFAFGASYSYRFVSARLGYHYGAESSLIPSFGAVGLTFRLLGIHIDAMYYLAKEGNPLKNNLSFGLGYSF